MKCGKHLSVPWQRHTFGVTGKQSVRDFPDDRYESLMNFVRIFGVFSA